MNEYIYYRYILVFYCTYHDLFIAGKIACANVISDLYAMGVTDVDNILMLLAVSTKMTEKERDVVIPLIMRGFKVIMLSSKLHFITPNGILSAWLIPFWITQKYNICDILNI